MYEARKRDRERRETHTEREREVPSSLAVFVPLIIFEELLGVNGGG